METSFYNDLRSHQLDALEALIKVDSLFSSHDIEYYLVAGSALGAVRHKGFIPWDDDIDIGIKYCDKERAYRLLKEELPSPFVWIDRGVDSQYPRLYGKVLLNHVGLIDVFVLVKTSDNLVGKKTQWALRKILFKLYKAKIKYYNHNEARNKIELLKVKAARFISFFFSKKWINRQIENNEKRFEKKNVENYLNLYSAYSLEKELIRSEWLDGNHYEVFEGHMFPTPKDTDAYLKHLYGDYMKVPDEKDRVLRHEEYF